MQEIRHETLLNLGSALAGQLPAGVLSGLGPGHPVEESAVPIASRDPEARARCAAARKIQPALAYMLEHVTAPLRISTLSARAGMSPAHFFSLFKRATGNSPIAFLTRVRMRHARELLEQTPLTVKEVARSIGYRDPLYFSRIFKSVHGVAPGIWRAERMNSKLNVSS